MADGLERRGVVPVVVALIVLEDRRGPFTGGHRTGRPGLGAHGHVLLFDRWLRDIRRGAGLTGCGAGRRFGLVPVDVLDRSEELVQILEQIVALALVVGH